ncbi:MAG: hypothetical protein D6826_06025 [Alphaproteobacteria bacterium]|nr:MAG: hypothetical protein D6826_06025 [Alphaproteobacteria bacterium]
MGVILGIITGARAMPVSYGFEFFDSSGASVGSGLLSVEKTVLDAAPDLSALNSGIAPVGSKFVAMSDLADLSFTVFGTTYTLSDHSPVVFTTVEGVIFNGDESFNRFIDANVPGRPSATARRGSISAA